MIENVFPLCSQSYCIFFLAKVRFFMFLARWRIALGDHQGLFFLSILWGRWARDSSTREVSQIWLQHKKKSRIFFESLLCDGGMENPIVWIWQFEPSFLQNVANLGLLFLAKSFVKVLAPFLFFLFVTKQWNFTTQKKHWKSHISIFR